MRDLLEVGSGKPVERVPLCGLVQQRLMHVLAVKVDETVTDLGQQRCRRHPTVHVSARPPIDGNRPRQHDLSFVGDKAPFDDRLGGTCPHDGSIGPTSEQ